MAGEKILIVDDDPDIVEAMKVVCWRAGSMKLSSPKAGRRA